MTEKVLLDTDIGSDIDDAVCLAYLLANPDCDLVGITTVSGESQRRAQLCSALCVAAKRELPIFPGSESPLLVDSRQPSAPQASRLPFWPHREIFPKGQAVPFLQEMIHSYPHEITLLPIGPLTNIGLLFAMDPEIPSLLKQLVIMGGKFTCAHGFRTPEWNIWNDPHAAEIVYRANPPLHRSIGIDVTLSVSMNASEVAEQFQHPLLRLVADLAGVWFEHAEKMIFHDPLAGAVIFQPDICRYQRGEIAVELESTRLEGYTHWEPAMNGSKEIAVSVDSEAFFSHFFAPFQLSMEH